MAATAKVKICEKDSFLARLTVPTVCKQCDKAFERSCTSEWAFKRPNGAGVHYFCSWTCIRKYDQSKEQKHDRDFDW